MDESEDEFEERLRKLEAENAAKKRKPEPFEDDLIPDPGGSGYAPDDTDLEIDGIIDGIGILDAYRRWCGKSQPKEGKRTEGIKVSCPSPDHLDRDPSAWVNTEKDAGTCGGCGVGFDKFDIAAWHFGFDVPGYKSGRNFPELKRRMAEDLGYTVTKTLGGQTIVSGGPGVESEDVGDAGSSSEPEPPSLSVVSEPEPDGTVTSTLMEELNDGDDTIEYPTVPWRLLLDRSTFLRTWMQITSEDSLPEEFYFWLGMQALGFAAGRDVVMADHTDVRGNLFVCLFGPSGQGKSRGIGAMTSLLREALPYDHSDPNSTGTYMVPSPGSAEALVDAFSRPIEDDGKVVDYGHVRGLVRFDELSTLMGRASRAGNPMKPALMEFYDGYYDVEHKTRGMGLVKAVGAFASSVTTTQPKSIRNLMMQSDADSGFANRWIFAAGPAKPRISYGGVNLDIRRAVKPLEAIRAWSALPAHGRRLTLEGTALKIWDEFFHEELVPAQEGDESNLLVRCDLTMKKCITLFCIDRTEATPSAETVEAAIGVWPYLRSSYNLVSPLVGVGEFEYARNIIRDAVIRYEKRRGNPPTARDIGRSVRRAVPGDQLEKVIRTMVNLQELEEVTVKPKTGRATVRYHYAYGDA